MSETLPIQIDTDEAASRLAALISEVSSGREVIISNEGVPVAKLSSYKRPVNPVVFGEYKGQIRYNDADIIEPDKEIADLFENSGQGLCGY